MTIPRDTLSTARQEPVYPDRFQNQPRRPLSAAEVRDIQQAAERIQNNRPNPAPRPSTPRVVIIFLVSRLGMIPMMLFVVLPQKALELASPAFTNAAQQFLALTSAFMGMMARTAENIAQAFAPIREFAKKVQEGLNQVFQSGMASYQTLQKAIAQFAAKIKLPKGIELALLMKNLHEWARKASDLKQLYQSLANYLGKAFRASKEGAPETLNGLSKVFQTLRKMNAAVERRLEKWAQKVESRLKQVKEAAVEPVQHLIKTAVQEVHQMTMAAFARIQTTVQPVVNLAASMGAAAKAIGEGSFKNIMANIRAATAQVQSAVMSMARGISNIYQQLLVQSILQPFMATMNAAWGRAAAFQQRIQNYITNRYTAILREIREWAKRLASRLESLLGTIQGWAQRKWKQQILPTLKQIPKKAKEIAAIALYHATRFWKTLWSVLVELFWLLAEMGVNFAKMVREAFVEIAAQTSAYRK